MAEREDLFRFTSGPRNARCVIVGEAWGREEAAQQRPFAGQSGQLLDRMLAEAGLSRTAILCTNVISSQPPGNDFTHFLHSNEETKSARTTPYAGLSPKQQLATSIRDLWHLLDHVRPDLVIAAGNIPLHVLTPHAGVATKKGYKLPTGITSWRGSQTTSRYATSRDALHSSWFLPEKPLNVLPLIHPAAILREYEYRHVTVHDLRSRAARYLSGHTTWSAPPYNDIWRPSFHDVSLALNVWLAKASTANANPLRLSVDIETYGKTYISCLGLCDGDLALCIPFFFFANNSPRAYWSCEQELEIWLRLRNLLEHPNVSIIGQNYIYDSLFLQRYCGINTHCSFDTMVAHHLLYPGTPMGLHYLASLYCDHHCYWKDESDEWAAGELAAEDLWHYNCKDTRKTFECATVLSSLLARKPGYEAHFAWRMREWHLARKMSIRGTNDDSELRKKYKLDCFSQASELEALLLSFVPEKWRYAASGKPWFSSPQHTMYILYDRLGLEPVLHKVTKRPTADDTALETLIARKDSAYLRPMLTALQALRSLSVFHSHFLDIKSSPLGRFVTQFNIARPETFRWSSSANPMGEGTNMQNLPKVKED